LVTAAADRPRDRIWYSGASSRGLEDAELARKFLRKPTSAACKSSGQASKAEPVLTIQWHREMCNTCEQGPADAELVRRVLRRAEPARAVVKQIRYNASH
jgi:hypothetical protein